MVAAVVLLGLALLGPSAASAAAGFPDVSATNPYHLQIEVLAQLGVVGGFADGRFRPDAPVSRQQFAKMVVLAMRIPVSEADVSAFGDVARTGPESLFPDNYVAAVAREGITTGTKKPTSTTPGLFSPGAEISLAQVVTMMTRASGRTLDLAVLPAIGLSGAISTRRTVRRRGWPSTTACCATSRRRRSRRGRRPPAARWPPCSTT